MFAPGGFVERQPVRYAVRGLRRSGFDPVVAKYPTHDLAGAVKFATDLAKRNPRAYALGFSAGGTLAQNLAARGLVKRTVSVGSPGNLRKWDTNPSFWGYGDGATSQWDLVGATRRERWRASPDRLYRNRGPHRRSLVIHSRDDGMVPFEQAQEMARLSGGRLREAQGFHGSYFKSSMPRAIRFFRR